MTKKSSQIKYIGIITSVYSVRKMGSASLYRNSRKDSSVSETRTEDYCYQNVLENFLLAGLDARQIESFCHVQVQFLGAKMGLDRADTCRLGSRLRDFTS